MIFEAASSSYSEIDRTKKNYDPFCIHQTDDHNLIKTFGDFEDSIELEWKAMVEVSPDQD